MRTSTKSTIMKMSMILMVSSASVMANGDNTDPASMSPQQAQQHLQQGASMAREMGAEHEAQARDHAQEMQANQVSMAIRTEMQSREMAGMREQASREMGAEHKAQARDQAQEMQANQAGMANRTEMQSREMAGMREQAARIQGQQMTRRDHASSMARPNMPQRPSRPAMR